MKTKILILVAAFCCTILMSTNKLFAQGQSCLSCTTVTSTNYTYTFGIFCNGGSDIVVNSGDVLKFYRSTLQMTAGKKILVKSGGKLIVQDTHIFGCSQMWQGIEVDEGGIVQTIGNIANQSADGASVIEDAYVAIKFTFSPGNSVASAYTTEPLLVVDNTIFNKNEIGIQFNGHPDGVANSLSTSFSDIFKIGNCVFTCRYLAFTMGTQQYYDGQYGVTGFKQTTISSATYPSNPATYNNPYIDDTQYPDNVADAYLKPPFTASTAKSKYGIDLENFFHSTDGLLIGYTDGGTDNTKTTLFDNQDVGIWAYWSGFTAHNCTFQKPNPHLNIVNGTYAAGIYMDQGLAASTAIVETVSGSPNNAFYNMAEAIRGDYVRNTSISNCDIQSNQDVNPTVPPPYYAGDVGINLTLSIALNINVTNNNIYNIKLGIIMYEDGNYGNDDYMAVNISNNTVRATNPAIATAAPNNYVAWAIIATSGVYTLGYYNERIVNCNYNTLHDVQNGIMMNNWQGTNTHAEFNNIRLKLDPLATGGDYYGIWMVSGIPMDEFPFDPITFMPKTTGYAGNTVTGNAITGNSDAQHQIGIFAQLQYGTNYGCNDVDVLEHGVKFNDMCYSTVFWDNTMNINNQYGFTLSQAIIGQQGTMTAKGTGACPANNHWPGTNAQWQTNYSIPHWKTLNDNSYNINSAFVVKSTPVEFNPNGCGQIFNWLSGPGTFQYQHTATALSNTNTLLYAGTLQSDCNRCTGGASRMASNDEEADVATLEQIANETIELPADDADQRLYSLQQQLYDIVKARPELTVKSSELHSFAQANNWTVFDYIYYTGKYLAVNDANAADILLNYWPQTAKELDENYYQYYNWVTNMKLNKTYKPNLANVLALANKCPQKSGKVVYAARALYNGLTHSAHIFDNNCNAVASRQAITKKDNYIESKKISIYPNPITNGNFTVTLPQSTVAEALNWNISVTDIYGKTVMQKQLTAMQTQLSLNASSGLYFATLYNKNSSKQITTKIIVQ